MVHKINGRNGYFIILNELGYDSDFLGPWNADDEATSMIFDVWSTRHKLRIVWCFDDEEWDYHVVGDVRIEKQAIPSSLKGGLRRVFAKGVWQDCEEYLLRMNREPQLRECAGQDGASSPE